MNHTTLQMSRERANRLLSYLQAYRRHALTQCVPSLERNTTQRALQALQGKLIHHMDQQRATLAFPVSGEEIIALHTMVVALLQMTADEATTAQRDARLADLTSVKATLEQRSMDRKKTQGASPLR